MTNADKKTRARKLHSHGASIAAVARLLGITKNTASYWITGVNRRKAWKKRRRRRMALEELPLLHPIRCRTCGAMIAKFPCVACELRAKQKPTPGPFDPIKTHFNLNLDPETYARYLEVRATKTAQTKEEVPC